jgi:hypothetical protein
MRHVGEEVGTAERWVLLWCCCSEEAQTNCSQCCTPNAVLCAACSTDVSASPLVSCFRYNLLYWLWVYQECYKSWLASYVYCVLFCTLTVPNWSLGSHSGVLGVRVGCDDASLGESFLAFRSYALLLCRRISLTADPWRWQHHFSHLVTVSHSTRPKCLFI